MVLWERKSAQGQFEPSGRVNASHFAKPRTLEEMKTGDNTNVVVGAAVCSIGLILARY